MTSSRERPPRIIDESRIHRHRGPVERHRPGHPNSSQACLVLGVSAQLLDHAAPLLIVWTTHVEGRTRAPGDDVHLSRQRRQRSHGADQPGLFGYAPLDLDGPRRRRGQGIVPLTHRHRAGVPRQAVEAQLRAGVPRDRRHDADRQVELLEGAPLLDVDLQKRPEGPRVPTRRLERASRAGVPSSAS